MRWVGIGSREVVARLGDLFPQGDHVLSRTPRSTASAFLLLGGRSELFSRFVIRRQTRGADGLAGVVVSRAGRWVVGVDVLLLVCAFLLLKLVGEGFAGGGLCGLWLLVRGGGRVFWVDDLFEGIHFVVVFLFPGGRGGYTGRWVDSWAGTMDLFTSGCNVGSIERLSLCSGFGCTGTNQKPTTGERREKKKKRRSNPFYPIRNSFSIKRQPKGGGGGGGDGGMDWEEASFVISRHSSLCRLIWLPHLFSGSRSLVSTLTGTYTTASYTGVE